MKYYRIMPGAKSVFADECLDGDFIGADWEAPDLTNQLPDNHRQFNQWFIPMYREMHPDKSKISAGLAGGMLFTIAKGMDIGDMVLIPDQQGVIHFGKVASDYYYAPEGPLFHRRKVNWLPTTIHRHDLSEELQNSMGSIGTVSNVTKHAAEIQGVLAGVPLPISEFEYEEVEDPAAFALEKHLEDFLVANWDATDLGKAHQIYSEDGIKVGKQYMTDTGPLDILAVSNDGSELLVIELKRGRASDYVVGQIQRYMGYVKDELAEPNQTVRGVIIALDDDQKIRRALSVTTGIDFYRYRIDFHLQKISLSGA